MADRIVNATDQSRTAPDPLAVLLAALSLRGRGQDTRLQVRLLAKYAEIALDIGPTLAEYERKPELWIEPLRDRLRAAGVDRDADHGSENDRRRRDGRSR